VRTPKTFDEIVAGFETWSQERLHSGEDYIYLTKSELPTASVVEMPKKQPAVTSSLPIVHGDWQTATDLETLRSLISNCTKCDLHKTRTNFVFGVGNPNAKVMVVGEAPGADEDAKGEPFVGRAGQLLNKMLLAIGFPREEVFIANILKSRPPGNRDPQADEVASCEPYLWKQIDIIQPKLIICMGRIAGTNLLKNGIDTLAKMRGNVYDFRGAKVMVTYHPAALLRNPNWKAPAWEDLQKFRRLYDELVGDKGIFDPAQAKQA
jgi:uracil-DNA glycosylase